MWDDVEELWQETKRARKVGDYALAASSLEAILHDEQGSSALWALQGNNYEKLQRWQDAEENYLRAISIDPRNVTAHVALGWMYCLHELWGPAVTRLTAALQLDAEHAEANFFLGYALMSTGSLSEAEACFRRAIHKDPDNYEAPFYLGTVLLCLDQREPAIHAFRAALALNPNFEPARAALNQAIREQSVG